MIVRSACFVMVFFARHLPQRNSTAPAPVADPKILHASWHRWQLMIHTSFWQAAQRKPPTPRPASWIEPHAGQVTATMASLSPPAGS